MRRNLFLKSAVMAGVGRILPRAMMFALAAFAIVGPATAQTLTYTFDAGSSFTFSDGDSAVLTGSFSVDPPGDNLDALDVVITGTGKEAGTYEPLNSDINELLYTNSANSEDLSLVFDQNLGATNLRLTSVQWFGDGDRSTAVEVIGGAQLPAAVPEPSTWAMMLLGFAGVGLAALRRRGAVEAISANGVVTRRRRLGRLQRNDNQKRRPVSSCRARHFSNGSATTVHRRQAA
jgi:PEP-CTERM motif